MVETEFTPFPKVPRLNRECVITEKIDGTNASIWIGPGYRDDPVSLYSWRDEEGTDMVMRAGSRTRWITPQDDNYKFASWAEHNAEELSKLGPGHHFGEWWGRGIQRGYDLLGKRFSLFNVDRWFNERPACCHVVPVLHIGMFATGTVATVLEELAVKGSLAAPGFMRPEGIMVWHSASRSLFKATIEKDEEPKSRAVQREAA